MSVKQQENDGMERMTLYISRDLREWIEQKAKADHDRKPSRMAAIILEDAQKADKGLF